MTAAEFAAMKLAYLDKCAVKTVGGVPVGEPGEGEHHHLSISDAVMLIENPAIDAVVRAGVQRLITEAVGMTSILIHGYTLRQICRANLGG